MKHSYRIGDRVTTRGMKGTDEYDHGVVLEVGQVVDEDYTIRIHWLKCDEVYWEYVSCIRALPASAIVEGN